MMRSIVFAALLVPAGRFADRIGSVKDDIAKAADDVDALEPPSDAAGDTQTIADVLRRVAAVIDQIQKDAAKNDARSSGASAASSSL